jgi:hypothetical protein
MPLDPSAEIWRIVGSNAAPHYIDLRGIDSGPSLCNQTMVLKYVERSLRRKFLLEAKREEANLDRNCTNVRSS